MHGVKIAITGKMRSGKDLIAEYLVRKYGFRRFAFGDGVRAVTRLIYPDIQNSCMKPRSLYQQIGQALRQIDPAVWLNYTLEEIDASTNPFDSIVISDLRQPNEYKALLNNGFTIVRVQSTVENRLARMNAVGDVFTMDDINHETESHIDNFVVNFEITNNGRSGSLYEQIEWAVKSLKDRRCEGGNLQDRLLRKAKKDR
ncbi:hypothetical protein H1S01_18290 [Heliobacterium chlorum]|uniref:Uncharacterized protein n=1 Tax=Heliobacterium chlorum TaxID=2698 RepID=A0ABR7T6M7_HELCL|nr:hypothetical protein [Heliobacterium chlorum]MBC9786408.1 hypothetical protein [Heliobacterium chlorum]